MFDLAERWMRRLLPVFWVTSLGWPAVAVADEPLATLAGPLTLLSREAERAEDGVVVLLNGKPILKDEMMLHSTVAGRFPQDAPARVIVLGMGTGGSGCPLMLRLVDVGRKPVYVSRSFGTCYDEVTVTQSRNGTVVIEQPNIAGRGVSRWRYRNGALR